MNNPDRTRAERLRFVVKNQGDELLVFSPFSDRAAMRELPGARWDPDVRAWRVPAATRSQVERVLDRRAAQDERDIGVGADGAEVETAIVGLLTALRPSVRRGVLDGLALGFAFAANRAQGSDDHPCRSELEALLRAAARFGLQR
jgi:hypothetical protein